MLANKILGLYECEDNVTDEIAIVEGTIYDACVVDIKSINDDVETHIFLTKEKAFDIGKLLMKWSRDVTI